MIFAVEARKSLVDRNFRERPLMGGEEESRLARASWIEIAVVQLTILTALVEARKSLVDRNKLKIVSDTAFTVEARKSLVDRNIPRRRIF